MLILDMLNAVTPFNIYMYVLMCYGFKKTYLLYISYIYKNVYYAKDSLEEVIKNLIMIIRN